MEIKGKVAIITGAGGPVVRLLNALPEKQPPTIAKQSPTPVRMRIMNTAGTRRAHVLPWTSIAAYWTRSWSSSTA